MKNTTMLMKNLTYSLKNINKLISSLKHSLRIETRLKISEKYDREKSKDNLIYSENNNFNMEDSETERIKSIHKMLEDLKKLKSHYKSFATLSNPQSEKRSKSLKYLRNKLPNELLELLEKVQQEPTTENIENLQTVFDNSNIYQKPIIKNFNAYMEFVKFAGTSASKEAMNKIVYNEMLLKIPNHNQITNISHQDLIDYTKDYMARNFPNYEIGLIVGHEDELIDAVLTTENLDKPKEKTNHHIHLFHSTKNNLTNEFDFYQSQYEYVKNNLDKFLETDSILTEILTKKEMKEYKNTENKLTPTELFEKYCMGKGARSRKNLGILFQMLFYKDINKHLLNKKNITAYIKEEKKLEGINPKKIIFAKGEYNNISLQKKTQEANQEFLENEVKRQKEIIKEIENEKENLIEITQNELSRLDKLRGMVFETIPFKEAEESIGNISYKAYTHIEALTIKLEETKQNNISIQELEEEIISINKLRQQDDQRHQAILEKYNEKYQELQVEQDNLDKWKQEQIRKEIPAEAIKQLKDINDTTNYLQGQIDTLKGQLATKKAKQEEELNIILLDIEERKNNATEEQQDLIEKQNDLTELNKKIEKAKTTITEKEKEENEIDARIGKLDIAEIKKLEIILKATEEQLLKFQSSTTSTIDSIKKKSTPTM